MKYVIVIEKCIGCGSCVHFCKKGAIDYLGEICVIDQAKCDPSCGGKCIEYCPIDDTIVEMPHGTLSHDGGPGLSPKHAAYS